MVKIIVQFEHTLNDYSRVIRSFLTRKRLYWVSLGVYSICALIFLVLAVAGLFNDSLRMGFYLAPIFLLILLFTFYPFWSGWLTIRNAPKKEHLTLPAKYELDDERVVVVNELAEVKYDWNVFSKAYDDGQYFFISYSTNKNMFQFIPKRAFASVEQERITRDLIVRHLGEIEETQKGLTGWKLTVLTAILFSLIMLCVVVVAVSVAILM